MKQNPWETVEGRQVWKTESQYWVWLRGALRRVWADYPLRKVWKKSKLRPLTDTERASGNFHPSTKNIGQCELCGEWFAGSKLECDHLIASGGCTSREAAEQFLWHCAGLVADDFRLACKPCHKAQSHSQRVGVSFDEAVILKQAIAIQKIKGGDVAWLKERNIVPGKNSKIRKQQIVDAHK